jgi:hypothetical protein
MDHDHGIVIRGIRSAGPLVHVVTYSEVTLLWNRLLGGCSRAATIDGRVCPVGLQLYRPVLHQHFSK